MREASPSRPGQSRGSPYSAGPLLRPQNLLAKALTELELILPGYRKLGPEYVEDVLKIRRTIIGLRMGAGHLKSVRSDLHELEHDVLSALGTDSELAADVAEMLKRLRGLDG